MPVLDATDGRAARERRPRRIARIARLRSAVLRQRLSTLGQRNAVADVAGVAVRPTPEGLERERAADAAVARPISAIDPPGTMNVSVGSSGRATAVSLLAA